MRKNCLQCLQPKKQKQCLKVENGEQRKEGSTKEHQVKKVKVSAVQCCIQLIIAKNENFSKTLVTFCKKTVWICYIVLPCASCIQSFLNTY